MPFWANSSKWNSNTEGLVFQVYLDNSYSMERNPGQGTLYDQSLSAVQSLIQVNSVSTRYQFLDNDFKSGDMQSRSSELLNNRLTEENLSFRSRSLNSITTRFSDTDKLGHKNKHCFVFSDFQKSTIGKLDNTYDSTTQYYLVPVQSQSQQNVFIDSVWFDKPIVKKGDKLKVFYKAYNTGKENINELSFKLSVNKTQASISYLDVPANSSKVGSFDYLVTESGDLKGEISFEDGDLTFDNSFYFTLLSSNAIHVATVSEKGNPSYSSVFNQSNEFTIENYSSNEPNYAQLDKADFIIIEGFNQQSTSLVKRIAVWLTTGKSILIIPSKLDRSIPSDFATSLLIPVLPIKTIDSSLKAESSKLEFPDLNNPFFSDIFEEKNTSITMPYAKPSISLPPGYNALLKTVTGNTAISRSSKGSAYKGLVYLFHFPLEEQNTNLPQHSFFVPLLLKMALFSKENTENKYFRQGSDVIQISLSEETTGIVEIKDHKNQSIIPSQRLNGNQLTFDLPEQISKPGFYDLVRKGQVLRSFALNVGRAESLTPCYKAEELSELFKNQPQVKVLKNIADISLEEQLKELTKGVPLWKYCLILSLVFFLIEIVLIRWFKY